MPPIPKSNGLVEIQGTKQKERGFCCMKLIGFLTRDKVKDREEWHGAHLLAADHKCRYKDECPIHQRTQPQEPVKRFWFFL